METIHLTHYLLLPAIERDVNTEICSILSVNINIESVRTLAALHFLIKPPGWITNKGYLYGVMTGLLPPPSSLHPGVFSRETMGPPQHHRTTGPPH